MLVSLVQLVPVVLVVHVQEFQSGNVGNAPHVYHLIAVKRYHAAEFVAYFQFVHGLIAVAANANANAIANAPILNAQMYALAIAVAVAAVVQKPVVTLANYVSSIHQIFWRLGSTAWLYILNYNKNFANNIIISSSSYIKRSIRLFALWIIACLFGSVHEIFIRWVYYLSPFTIRLVFHKLRY